MERRLRQMDEESAAPTRHKILWLLKQRGEMTVAELSASLGITGMGVRRQLAALEQEQLVRYNLVQRGKGRPSHVYQLTAQAEELFPKNYARLANELLGYLAAEEGDAAVIRLFDRRAQRRIRDACAQLAGLSLAERVAGLVRILTADGYQAEWSEPEAGLFLLIEHNCAVHDIAAEFSAACSSELMFLRAVLPDAEVERVHHMMAGEPMCAYRIRPQGGSSTP